MVVDIFALFFFKSQIPDLSGDAGLDTAKVLRLLTAQAQHRQTDDYLCKSTYYSIKALRYITASDQNLHVISQSCCSIVNTDPP